MHPRIAHIGILVLPTYGVLVAIGVVVALYCSVRIARQLEIDPALVWNLGVIAIFCSLLGSRLLLIFANFRDFLAHPLWMLGLATMRSDGLLAGGVLFGCAAATVYARIVHLPLLRTLDAVAPSLALGHAIGRLGCFAAGCCYGRETHLPWAVTFTSPLAAKWSGTPLGVPLHPTQLYESAVEVALFVFLLWLLPRRTKSNSEPNRVFNARPGEIAGAWLFLYGLARFMLEFLRGDPGRGQVLGGVLGGALSFPQAIAVCMVIAGGMLWLKRDTVVPSGKITKVA